MKMKIIMTILIIILLLNLMGCANNEEVILELQNKLDLSEKTISKKQLGIDKGLSDIEKLNKVVVGLEEELKITNEKLKSEDVKLTSPYIAQIDGRLIGEFSRPLSQWAYGLVNKYNFFSTLVEDKLNEEELKILRKYERFLNQTYYVYNNNKFIGETKGTLIFKDFAYGPEPILSFDKELEGIYIAGSSNHLPNNVETIYDITFEDKKEHILTDDEEFFKKILEKGKDIVPNNLDVDIAQIIKCNLYDSDRRSEIIVNYSNVYKDGVDVYENHEEPNNYYTVVVLLDENLNVKDYIHNMYGIDSYDGLSLYYTHVSHVLNLYDRGSVMQIISESLGYEGGNLYYVDRLGMVNNLIRDRY